MSKKQKDQVQVLMPKLINVSFDQARLFADSEYKDMDSAELKELKDAKNTFRTRIAQILEKNKTLSAFGKSDKGVEWLTKQTNKLMRKMKALLSEKTYNELYSPDHFIPWTDKEALAVLVPSESDSLGILDENLEFGSDDSDAELTIVGATANDTFKNLHDFWNNTGDTVPQLSTIINNGMDAFGKPLVNECIDDLYTYINQSSEGDQVFEAERADLFQQLFGEIVSCCSRLMKSSGEGPFRDFMIDEEYITKDHVKDQSPLRESTIKSLRTKALIEIESQTRKSGPRSSGTQDQFWSQLTYSYTHAKTNIDKDLVDLLKEVSDELAEEFISKVGYVHPIPYVMGIESSQDIAVIYDAIHGPDSELAEESFKIWEKLLKNSLGSDCVYAHVKKSTNKGAPYYTSKLTTMEWLNLIYSFYNRFEDPSNSSNLYPFIPGQRLQNSTISDEGCKTRDRIIMQMAAMYISHQAWNIPLLRKMKELPYFASYVSHENVGFELDKIMENLDENSHLLSMDYQNYDANTGPEMKEDHLWSFLGRIFADPTMSLDQRKGFLDTPYTKALMKEWKSFYTMATIIIPGGILWGLHGLFSGAPGTTIIGSLLNLLKVKAAIKFFKLLLDFLFIQGDDTAFSYKCTDRQVQLKEISEFMDRLGHKVAMDEVKQAYMKFDKKETTYIMFVGKYYFLTNPEEEIKTNVPVYSIVDMFSRFVFPELAKMSLDEKLIKDWSPYDFNKFEYIYKSKKRKDPLTGEVLLDPSLVMSVRITQSLINTINHPEHNKVVTKLVKTFPGLFKPLKNFGNVKSASVFETDGTLIGLDSSLLLEGFGSQPTVKLIIDLLEGIEHTYERTILMEDIEQAIKDVKDMKKKSSNNDIPDNDFKSQLGQAKKSLIDVLSSKAWNELTKLERSGK